MEPLLTDITSTASPETSLLRTPLYDLHLELGARMVPFAGYSMPVQYPAGLMAEHLHTRASAGLFDVSHMGQLSISGDDSAAALESLMPVDVIGLAPGRQRYGMLRVVCARGCHQDVDVRCHRPRPREANMCVHAEMASGR